jgi:2-dehydro-3-deoxyphosphooctonate aldolase (KDO 8-P synthase)
MNKNLYQSFKDGKVIIAGPCVLEDYEKALSIAKFADDICKKFGFTYVFKASFDKANRTSGSSFRGVGIEKGIEIFKEISKSYHTLTDFHTPEQAEQLAEHVDILQVPAFLCRQTDMLIAAAQTNKIVNIKKFQMLSGSDMLRPLEKVLKQGNEKVILTERGTLIPYGNLILDLRNIVDMLQLGVPVVMDCTHTCQALQPQQEKTSGRIEMAPIYAQAAAVCGVKSFFAEIYPNPKEAKSDAETSLDFKSFEELIDKVNKILG